jgi:hypothetical protein
LFEKLAQYVLAFWAASRVIFNACSSVNAPFSLESCLPFLFGLAFREDVATAKRGVNMHGTCPQDIYRNITAAAESGWDFSSRWMHPNGTLANLRTVAIVPVDLNTFLWKLENVLATLCSSKERSADTQQVAILRKLLSWFVLASTKLYSNVPYL